MTVIENVYIIYLDILWILVFKIWLYLGIYIFVLETVNLKLCDENYVQKYVCVNLTTKTSKYWVDVSQIFSSVFPQRSFEPTFEKIEAHFFSEIFSRDLEKFIFFVWDRN